MQHALCRVAHAPCGTLQTARHTISGVYRCIRSSSQPAGHAPGHARSTAASEWVTAGHWCPCGGRVASYVRLPAGRHRRASLLVASDAARRSSCMPRLRLRPQPRSMRRGLVWCDVVACHCGHTGVSVEGIEYLSQRCVGLKLLDDYPRLCFSGCADRDCRRGTESACNPQHATCSMQHATCNMQHTIQHTTRDATHTTQHKTHTTHHPPSTIHRDECPPRRRCCSSVSNEFRPCEPRPDASSPASSPK